MTDVLIILGSSAVGLIWVWLERAFDAARAELLGGEGG
jgi:hypothetical protein